MEKHPLLTRENNASSDGPYRNPGRGHDAAQQQLHIVAQPLCEVSV